MADLLSILHSCGMLVDHGDLGRRRCHHPYFTFRAILFDCYPVVHHLVCLAARWVERFDRVGMESDDGQVDTSQCCGSVIAAVVEGGMAMGSLLLLLTGSNVIYYWLGRIPFIPLALASPLIFFIVSVISVWKLDQFIRDIRSLQ